MPTGLAFVHLMLVLAGTCAALLCVGLLMADTAPPAQLARARRRLGERWRGLHATPWGRVPGCMTAWLADILGRLVRSGFAEADRRMAFGGLVMGLMFVLVPGAALVNALFGGRQFLLWHYLSLAVVLAAVNFLGETGRFRLLNSMAAAYLGLSLMLVIPVYLVHSFTDVTIKSVFSHGVLKSVLVAVFWYVAAYGAALAFATAQRLAGIDAARSPAAGFINAFLAALPVAFVLTFVALLAGHFAVFEQSPFRSWRLVLWSTGLTSLAFAVTLSLMAWAGRMGKGGSCRRRLLAAYIVALLAAAGLTVLLAKGAYDLPRQPADWADAVDILLGRAPDRAGIYLGPRFWVSHLPFLPVCAFVAAAACGLVGKAATLALAFLIGDAAPAERPFLAAGATAGGVAVLLWGWAAVPWPGLN
jgi:hypothetical protein